MMVIDGRSTGWLSVASGPGRLQPIRAALNLRRAGFCRQWGYQHERGPAMQQAEFDRIIAALGRAEFAVEELRKKAIELYRKSTAAKTLEEIAAVNLEAAELLQQIVKVTTAVHIGNSAPHLRLVPNIE
jgi:hypothetical protein